MKSDRSEPIIARVVAWHNRHPLARRITAAEVGSLGSVALPYAASGALLDEPPPPAPPPAAAPAGAPAVAEVVLGDADPAAAAGPAASKAAAPAAARAPRVRALPPRPGRWNLLARLRTAFGRGPLQALFSEDFMAPLSPRRVARWAAGHGALERPESIPGPERRIERDPKIQPRDPQAAELTLHLLTAAIEQGGERRRVLMAEGDAGPVWGPRLWSRRRMSVAAALPVTLVGVSLTAWLLLRPAAPSGALAAAAAASAASAPLASASGAVMTAAAPSGPPPRFTDDGKPVDVEPHVGRIDLPSIRPPAGAAAPAGADVAEAAGPAASGAPGSLLAAAPGASAPSAAAAASAAAPAVAAAPAQAAVSARVWALVTEGSPSRTRTEAQAAQLRAVAKVLPRPLIVETLQAGRRWHAIFFPFSNEAEAEKVRMALADKGLPTVAIDF